MKGETRHVYTAAQNVADLDKASPDVRSDTLGGQGA